MRTCTVLLIGHTGVGGDRSEYIIQFNAFISCVKPLKVIRLCFEEEKKT